MDNELWQRLCLVNEQVHLASAAVWRDHAVLPVGDDLPELPDAPIDEPIYDDPPADEPDPPIVTDPTDADGWTPRPTEGHLVPIGTPSPMAGSDPVVLLQRGGDWSGMTVPPGRNVGAYGDPSLPMPRINGELKLGKGAHAYDLLVDKSRISFSDDSRAEGCWVTGATGYALNIRNCKNATAYRCNILDSSKQGVWMTDTDGVRIEQCVIDKVTREHGVYSSHNTRTLYLRNLFANIAQYAIKARAGGPSEDVQIIGNYFFNCIDPLQVNNEDPTHPEYEHVRLVVTANVYDSSRDHWAGMLIKHTTGLTIMNNKFVRDQTRYYHAGIDLQGRIRGDVLIADNEFDGLSTSQCIWWRGETPPGPNVVVRDNLLQTQATEATKGIGAIRLSNNRYGPEPVAVDLMTPETLQVMRERRYGNWTVGSWEKP